MEVCFQIRRAMYVCYICTWIYQEVLALLLHQCALYAMKKRELILYVQLRSCFDFFLYACKTGQSFKRTEMAWEFLKLKELKHELLELQRSVAACLKRFPSPRSTWQQPW